MFSASKYGDSRDGGGGSGGASAIKEAIARRDRNLRKSQVNQLKYVDSMKEALNKEIQETCFPYWRNHPSLKGK